MRLRHDVLAAPLLAAGLALAALSGCATVPTVTAEQAAGADVSAYPSFAFFEPFDLEREGYGTLIGERPRRGPDLSLGLGLGVPLGGGQRQGSRLPGAISIDMVDTTARRVVWTGSVDVQRSGRDGEREALENALLRVMAALPRRS